MATRGDVATEPISQETLANLRALARRGRETGEVFAYDPATRQAEVFRPRSGASGPVGIVTLPPQRAPVVRAHVRRGAEARPRNRRVRRSSGSRSDPPDPEDDPDVAHRFDREVMAAIWRRRRAEAGKVYEFKIPPGAAA